MSDFIEQGGRLIDNGYLIVPIKQGEKRPAIGGWQNARLLVADLPRYANCGVGVLTGQGSSPVVALDIDTGNQELAERFVAWCHENLGFTVERVGKAPKILLVYQSAACDKVTSKWLAPSWVQENGRWYSEGVEYIDGKTTHKTLPHRLEVLGTGQQFVAYHIHPDTGKPYEWVDFIGGLEHLRADELPLVSNEQISQAVFEFERLADELGLQPMPQSIIKSPDVPKVRTKAADDDFFGRVNQEAIDHLDCWVPVLFPNARDYNGGFRVSSADLNRDLEEDLSLLPQGIVDFGVADIGDERHGKRTPIDIVLEWGVFCFDEPLDAPHTPLEAALWLCECLNISKETLGFGLKATREKVSQRLKQRKHFEDLKNKIEACTDAEVLINEIAKEMGEVVKDNIALETIAINLIKDVFKRINDGNTAVSIRTVKLAMFGGKQSASPLKDGRYQNTEFGNADRLLDAHGENLMYIKETGKWHVWDGSCWRCGMGVDIEHLAKETVTSMPSEVKKIESDVERADFLNFCALSQKDKMIKSMIWLAKSNPRVALSTYELNKDNLLLGCANGVVDLSTGEISSPDQSFRITYSTGVDYSIDADCPLFKQTVLDVFNGDLEMVSFFQRLIGYIALGDPCEQLIVIPYGSGANGKSTVLDVIQTALGDYARSADSSTFLSNGRQGGNAGGAREDLLRLRGARLVSGTEPNEGSVLREDLIKAMTGGEKLAARALYATETIEFKPTFTVVMPTNHKPTIKGDDYGIWRRIMLIPFTRNFDKDPNVVKDPYRPAKLLLELSGILRWIVEGAMAYQRMGLNPPASVQQARDEYKSSMDLITPWIEECWDFHPDFEVASRDLWRSWQQWTSANGIMGTTNTPIKLTNKLRERGYKFKRGVHALDGKRTDGFTGFRLKSDFEDLNNV